MGSTSNSFYAPAERAAPEVVQQARQTLLLDPLVTTMLEAMPCFTLLLNQQRQILAVNSQLAAALSLTDLEQVIGKRPGEAVQCIFSADENAGCGTSRHCIGCGAVRSVLEAQQTGRKSVHECHLTLGGPNTTAADFEVTAIPATVGLVPVTIVTLKDITDEKRLALLEKIFFHDLINNAGGIHGIATVLAEGVLPPEKEQEYKKWLVDLIDEMVGEIKDQRRLLQAERGEFTPRNVLISIPRILREVQALYINHEVAQGRNLVISGNPQGELVSDASVIRRILGNMVKNALEAVEKGETVSISCRKEGDEVVFSIHNPGMMPPEVQSQLFQRSVSTKSPYDRGIGTYSIKLLGERYLNGRVNFSSNEEEGTTFTLVLPKGC